MDADFDVWGMHINTDGQDPFLFCKEKDYLGVGWMLDEDVNERNRIQEIYESEHGEFHTGAKSLIERVSGGDFVWIHESGGYYLAKVTSDWKQKSKGKEPWTTHDIGFYREADWRSTPIDESAVPGFVIRYFAGRPGTMKKMRTGVNKHSKQYIQELHDQGEPDEKTDLEQIGREVADEMEPTNEYLLNMLGPRELEDVVLVYLQSDDWRLIKSSRPKARGLVECTLHRHSGGERETAYVQVKSGEGSVEMEDYHNLATDTTRVFIHQKNSLVSDKETIEYISPADLLEYIGESILEFDSMTIHKLAFALGIRQ
jgi:hypothetical protein